jgi:O-antigen/teichoic acid export membrane protein
MIRTTVNYLRGPGLGPHLVKAIAGSAGLRVAGMGFGFLVGVQLARGLGASGYGIYGLAMSVITVLAVPIQFGLPQLIIREVAAAQALSDWGRLRGIIRWSNRAVLVTATVVAAGVLVWLLATGERFGTPLARSMLVGLAMLPLVGFGSLRGAALLGLHQPVRAQLPNELLRPAMFSLLLLVGPLLLGEHLDPVLAMAFGTLAAAFTIACYSRMLRRAMPIEVAAAVAAEEPRAWRRSAFPMALAEGMRVLQGQLMTLVLGMMTITAVVGVYRVASSVALLVAMPMSLLNVICASVISRLHAQSDQARLQRLLSWVAAATTLAVALLALPFFVAGRPLLGRLFGHEFADSNLPLLILCGGVIANAFFGLNAQVLNMTGHEQRVTQAFAMSLVALALVAPPLVYWLHAEGAALASVVSVLLWNVQMWLDARRCTGLDTSMVWLLKRGDTHV